MTITEDVVRRGYAPGPLTSRIYGVPMRAARTRSISQRIFDRRWDAWQDGLIEEGIRARACLFCGDEHCPRIDQAWLFTPMH